MTEIPSVSPDAAARAADDAALTTRGTLRHRYLVRPTECGASDRLAPSALLDLFQEAAGADADRLGFGLDAMRAAGRAWVLHRIAVRVTGAMPRIGEGVTVETWPAPAEGALSARHALVTADDGAPIAAITTRWLYIDAARRRPLRPTPELMAFARADLDVPLVIPADAPSGPVTGPSAPIVVCVPIRVLRRDLDVMNHANNVHFAEWMMEALPDEVVARPVVDLDLLIRAEALYGDHLIAEAAPANGTDAATADTWAHVLHRDGDARPIATMRTRWG